MCVCVCASVCVSACVCVCVSVSVREQGKVMFSSPTAKKKYTQKKYTQNVSSTYCEDVQLATFILSSWQCCCQVDGLEATHDPYSSISFWQYFAVIFMAACLLGERSHVGQLIQF